MDDSERRPPVPSGQAPRLNKVIRGDAATTDSPQYEKPALRPPPRAGVVNAEEFEARTTAKDIINDAMDKFTLPFNAAIEKQGRDRATFEAGAANRKAEGQVQLYIAGGAFAAFLAIVFLSIVVKIERDLRGLTRQD